MMRFYLLTTSIFLFVPHFLSALLIRFFRRMGRTCNRNVIIDLRETAHDNFYVNRKLMLGKWERIYRGERNLRQDASTIAVIELMRLHVEPQRI